MPRRADALFAQIASFRALHAATLAAVKGKRRKPGRAAFMANAVAETGTRETLTRQPNCA